MMIVFQVILLVLVFIIFFILFCPFRVKLVYRDEVMLRMGYLFPVFKVLPKNPKPPKKKPVKVSETKPSESRIKTKTKKKNPVREFTKKNGLEGVIELLKEIVTMILKLADAVRRHLVISRMRLDLLVAGEDPADTAMKYGYACSAIYPLVSMIDRHTKLRRHEEYIDAGFQAEHTQVCLILDVHIVPVFAVIAAVEALIGSIKIFLKLRQ